MRKSRLTKQEIERITELIKEGKSLNSITKLTGKSKTTIYYYFRNIKGKTTQPINIETEDDGLIGEFIGLFAGDGCADITNDYKYRTYLYFNITEKEFVKNLVENVLMKLFKKNQ